MPEQDPAQRYRDWLMQVGMAEHVNAAGARYAARHGEPEPKRVPMPPPPPGCTEDRELKAAARKERARERRQAKRDGTAPSSGQKTSVPAPGRPPRGDEPSGPPATRTVGRPRPGRAA